MADTRYLKKRRQTWYFVIKVPADLVSKLGKTELVKTLKTRDLSKAQADRWPLVAEWMALFEVHRGTRAWTPSEIEEKAKQEYHDTLAMLAEHDEDAENTSIFADLEQEKLEREDLDELEFARTSARLKAAIGRKAALSGSLLEPPTSFGRNAIDLTTLQPVGAKKRKNGELFAEAARRYIEESQRDPAARKTEQTRGQYEATYRLFDQWADKPHLDDVDRKQAALFLDRVATLDPLWGRSPLTKQRTFAEIFEEFGNHGKGLSNRTVNRYATALSMVWQWAKKRGLSNGDDPWTDQYRSLGERRKTAKFPFSSDEMKALLKTAPEVRPEKQSHSNTIAWLSLLAAYSGMRLNEMCNRKAADLKQMDGVWYFDITKAKSEAGDRKVPVHSKLINAGLLDFVRHHGEEWLFPVLKPGGPDKKRSWYISKRFTEHRRDLGVVRHDPETGKDRVDFHSFRRSVVKVLERARLPQTEAAQVIGHDREGITFGVYNPEGLDIHALQQVVEAIKYPDLE